jgi:hypothetical protein
MNQIMILKLKAMKTLSIESEGRWTREENYGCGFKGKVGQ